MYSVRTYISTPIGPIRERSDEVETLSVNHIASMSYLYQNMKSFADRGHSRHWKPFHPRLRSRAQDTRLSEHTSTSSDRMPAPSIESLIARIGLSKTSVAGFARFSEVDSPLIF